MTSAHANCFPPKEGVVDTDAVLRENAALRDELVALRRLLAAHGVSATSHQRDEIPQDSSDWDSEERVRQSRAVLYNRDAEVEVDDAEDDDATGAASPAPVKVPLSADESPLVHDDGYVGYHEEEEEEEEEGEEEDSRVPVVAVPVAPGDIPSYEDDDEDEDETGDGCDDDDDDTDNNSRGGTGSAATGGRSRKKRSKRRRGGVKVGPKQRKGNKPKKGKKAATKKKRRRQRRKERRLRLREIQASGTELVLRSVFHENESDAMTEGVDLKRRVLKRLLAHNLSVQAVDSLESLETLLDREKEKVDFSAFYFVNLGAVVEKYIQWQHALSRARPFFAVKSNPDPYLLRTLATLGAGFDCASQNELEAVLALGVPPQDIIFANPCKGVPHIEYARLHGVKRMTFDNEAELRKIVRLFPEAEVVLRILVDDSASPMPFGSKFGANWGASMLLIELSATLGANLIGISFHVGSGCTSSSAYVGAIHLARAMFDTAARHGITMNFLDIGGGWPGTDEDSSRMPFAAIARDLVPVLDSVFPPPVTVIAEPGRFFCTQACTLAVVVNSKRVVESARDLAQLARRAAVSTTTNPMSGKKLNETTATGTAASAASAAAGGGHAPASSSGTSRPVVPTDLANEDSSDTESEADGDESDAGANVARADSSAPAALSDNATSSGTNQGQSQRAGVSFDTGIGDETDTTASDSDAEVHPKRKILYYLSDGVYGSFNNIIFDHAVVEPIPLRKVPDDAVLLHSTLFGPTCDSIDVVCQDTLLPELEIGDWLYFPNMGAYTIASASAFNGFVPPRCRYIMHLTAPPAPGGSLDYTNGENRAFMRRVRSTPQLHDSSSGPSSS